MKYLEINTVKRTMLPITILNWFFGTAVFEYPVSRQHPNLSAGWCLFHFTLSVTFVFFADSTDPIAYRGSRIVAVNMQIQHVYNLIVMMLLLYIGHKKSKLVSECSDKLDRLNNVLKNMDIPDNYQRTFNVLILKIVGTFVACVIVILVGEMHSKAIYSSELSRIGFNASYYHSLILCTVVDGTFATYMSYIGNRFWHLNEYLKDKLAVEDSILASSSRDKCHRVSTSNPTIREDTEFIVETREQRRLHLLQKFKQIHRSLWHVARDMKEAYEIQLLFTITASVIRISALCYMIYGKLIHLSQDRSSNVSLIVHIVNYCYWIVFDSLKIFRVVDACSRTSTEARRTVSLTYEIFSPTSSIDVEAEVRAFSLQLIQEPPHFTASGIMTLNYELVGEIAGYVITYVVLLLQLRDIAGVATIASNITVLTTNSTTYC